MPTCCFQIFAERRRVGKSGRDWQGASGRPAPLCRECRRRRRRPERPAEMNGFGLSRERFALLFSVMLVAAAGNTAMQSLLPAIGRELGVADIWVAVAFSLSAVVWVVMAPIWAHRADRRGRRALMRLGLYGFIVSMLICGARARRRASPASPGRCWSSPSSCSGGPSTAPSARPRRPRSRPISPRAPRAQQRTNALAAIASSFGLGTIIGPAIAPLVHLPAARPVGAAVRLRADRRDRARR